MSAVTSTWARRLGQNRCHSIDVPAEAVIATTIFGVPANVIDGPVVARCGVVLRGTLVQLDEQRREVVLQSAYTCAVCHYITMTDDAA